MWTPVECINKNGKMVLNDKHIKLDILYYILQKWNKTLYCNRESELLVHFPYHYNDY